MRAFTAAIVGVLLLSFAQVAYAGWGPWVKMGGSYTADPALCHELFKTSRAYVAAKGADSAIWMRVWNGSAWEPAFSLGGRWNSSPSLVCTPDRVDVFARGIDNNINYNTLNLNTGRWTGWRPITVGTVASGPAAVYAGGNSLAVFARGYGGTLKMTKSAFDRWSPWVDYGGQFVGLANGSLLHEPQADRRSQMGSHVGKSRGIDGGRQWRRRHLVHLEQADRCHPGTRQRSLDALLRSLIVKIGSIRSASRSIS